MIFPDSTDTLLDKNANDAIITGFLMDYHRITITFQLTLKNDKMREMFSFEFEIQTQKNLFLYRFWRLKGLNKAHCQELDLKIKEHNVYLFFNNRIITYSALELLII